MKYCPYCGAGLCDGAVSFCSECGKKMPEVRTAKAEPQRVDEEKQRAPKRKGKEGIAKEQIKKSAAVSLKPQKR